MTSVGREEFMDALGAGPNSIGRVKDLVDMASRLR
jgi:hypothetical protein